MAAVDRNDWPTKAEVCKTLSLSMSQINNLVKARRLEIRMRKRPGLPPVGVVNPADVARELDQRQAVETRPHVLSEGTAVPAPAATHSGLVKVTASAERRLIKLVNLRRQREMLGVGLPFWLTYDEAVIVTGLSEARLHELVKEGKVKT